MRGSKPGERRGGRKPGTPNKATATVRDAAQQYTEEALATLAGIMRGDDHPAAARVSAATALLDRGHGKPTQGIEATGANGEPLAPTVGLFAALSPEKRAAMREAIKKALAS